MVNNFPSKHFSCELPVKTVLSYRTLTYSCTMTLQMLINALWVRIPRCHFCIRTVLLVFFMDSCMIWYPLTFLWTNDPTRLVLICRNLWALLHLWYLLKYLLVLCPCATDCCCGDMKDHTIFESPSWQEFIIQSLVFI